MRYEMPVVPAELREQLIRFLSDREARIEFSLEMYSRLHDLGEAVALAVLTKDAEAPCLSASSS